MFGRGVATPDGEQRLFGAWELPESTCTCGSGCFSLPPRLYLPCPNSCCGLVTSKHFITDIPVTSEPQTVKRPPLARCLTRAERVFSSQIIFLSEIMRFLQVDFFFFSLCSGVTCLAPRR